MLVSYHLSTVIGMAMARRAADDAQAAATATATATATAASQLLVEAADERVAVLRDVLATERGLVDQHSTRLLQLQAWNQWLRVLHAMAKTKHKTQRHAHGARRLVPLLLAAAGGGGGGGERSAGKGRWLRCHAIRLGWRVWVLVLDRHRRHCKQITLLIRHRASQACGCALRVWRGRVHSMQRRRACARSLLRRRASQACGCALRVWRGRVHSMQRRRACARSLLRIRHGHCCWAGGGCWFSQLRVAWRMWVLVSYHLSTCENGPTIEFEGMLNDLNGKANFASRKLVDSRNVFPRTVSRIMVRWCRKWWMKLCKCVEMARWATIQNVVANELDTLRQQVKMGQTN